MRYSFLDLIKKMDCVPYFYEEEKHDAFRKAVYTLVSHDASFKLGYILPLVAKELAKHPEVFLVDDSTREVRIEPRLDTVEARNEAIAVLAKQLKDDEVFDHLKGWRNELYTIFGPGRKPYMHVERAFTPELGVVLYGVHLNGYVQNSATGEIKMWIPRRARTKQTYPGMLDNTVAGGLGHPYGCLETMVKESYEEAGLEAHYITEDADAVGVISYIYQLKPGDYETEAGFVQPEAGYIYDLKMDPKVIPHPVDGESEDFRLMDIDEVTEHLHNGDFKHNCGAIIIDFFMRHGLITPEDEPDYLEIQSRLHRLMPFPTM